MSDFSVPSLYGYVQQAERFLRDQGQRWINPADLIEYVNRARREVAMRTQSIRILTPVSGEITRIEVTDPGSGYTDPVVTISPPDAPTGMVPNPGGAQATAIPIVSGGQILSIGVEFGGDGYFRPEVTITDKDGTGALATAYTVPLTVTQGHQELYPFSAVPLTRFPGVAEIFACKSVSFIYANYRYSIPVYPFSYYQAYIRRYPQQFLFVPTAAAQFGQGVGGSLYLYPIPSDIYQMELDVFCLPIDLLDDEGFEAIPKPWTDAVPYFVAHLAFAELQNLNASQYFLNLYDSMVHRYSAYARPGRAINPLGRHGM
jgi:hypothetical protein